MLRKRSGIILIGLLAITLEACGTHQSPQTGPQTPSNPNLSVKSLDTAGVLAIAQQTSETSTPFPVDGGALVLTDTSETSEPISIDGM